MLESTNNIEEVQMYKYIIVDDEAPIQMGIKKRLNDISLELEFCGFAYNGSEALALISETNPDIIITDMNMPMMDGGALLSELTSKYTDKQIIVISGYKDFEYLHIAIQSGVVDYILKPFSKKDLLCAVKKAIQKLNDGSASSSKPSEEDLNYYNDLKLIKSIIYNKPSIEPALNSNKLLHLNSSNRLIMMTIHSENIIPEYLIKQFLKENEFGNYVLFLQHELNPNINFFLIFIPKNSLINYKQFARQIADSLTEQYNSNNPLIFGISNMHNNIMELHNAFEETVKAINTRKSSDNFNIYTYNPQYSFTNNIKWDKQPAFLFRLETGDYDNVKNLLNELFYFLEVNNLSIGEIKYFLINLFEKSRIILNRYFNNIHTVSASYSTQMVYFTMFTFDELKKYYMQFFSNIAKVLNEQNIYSDKTDIIEQMKTYINKNYMNNISIELLSDLFYINKSYCSSLFKEKTGQNFVDYLNSIRIEQAKELLKNTDKKISRIAIESGYNNNKYFYRIFKKITGITPNEYRNKLLY